MTIMRSWCFMKDKLVKRRVHVHWNDVRVNIEDFAVNVIWAEYKTCSSTKKMNDDRLSYYALLRVFGKNKLNYFRHTGDYSVFIGARV